MREKPGLPATTEMGFRQQSEGGGLAIEKRNELEIPPPGDGLNTVTVAVPAKAISLSGMTALNCVLLRNVVLRF